jgi:hypothetical protein
MIQDKEVNIIPDKEVNIIPDKSNKSTNIELETIKISTHDSNNKIPKITEDSVPNKIKSDVKIHMNNNDKPNLPIVNNQFNQPFQNTDYDSLREKLNDLRKQKRENEYFIRVSEQAKQFKTDNLNKEIRKKTNKINNFRALNRDNHPTPYTTLEDSEKNSNSLGTNEFDPSNDVDQDINMVYGNTNPEIELLTREVSKLKRELEVSVDEIEFKIEEKKIENIEIENLMKNNWGVDNTNTVNKWIQELNKETFIYERITEIIQNKLGNLTMIVFILSGIQSLLNVSNFGIKEEEHPELELVIKIILAVLSLIMSVVTFYISNNKFEDIIQKYTKYTGKLDKFLSNIVPVIKIKPELRPDGDQFVLDNVRDYSDIYAESPYISEKYLDKCYKDYTNYVLNTNTHKEIHCSRKRVNYSDFARQDNVTNDTGDCVKIDIAKKKR